MPRLVQSNFWRMGWYFQHSRQYKINNLQAPNLDCFVSRVASHPERLKYMYFNTVLLMRAVARLGPYLSSYDYCSCSSEDHTEDVFTHQKLSNVLDIATRAGQFDETALFKGENANVCCLFLRGLLFLTRKDRRLSRKNSKNISGMLAVSWTASVVINAVYGARSKPQALRLL